MEKWKNPSEIEKAFSPRNWGYVSSNIEKAYLSDTPTLGSYSDCFGFENAKKWIHSQVLALYGMSGNKDEGVAEGLSFFSSSFASQTMNYKLSELMLFFSRYKSGKYDNSYASFDTKRIGNAFFFEFVKERKYEIDLIERKKIIERIDENYRNSVTYEEYLEIKKQAENGDTEAQRRLNIKND